MRCAARVTAAARAGTTVRAHFDRAPAVKQREHGADCRQSPDSPAHEWHKDSTLARESRISSLFAFAPKKRGSNWAMGMLDSLSDALENSVRALGRAVRSAGLGLQSHGGTAFIRRRAGLGSFRGSSQGGKVHAEQQ